MFAPTSAPIALGTRPHNDIHAHRLQRRDLRRGIHMALPSDRLNRRRHAGHSQVFPHCLLPSPRLVTAWFSIKRSNAACDLRGATEHASAVRPGSSRSQPQRVPQRTTRTYASGSTQSTDVPRPRGAAMLTTSPRGSDYAGEHTFLSVASRRRLGKQMSRLKRDGAALQSLCRSQIVTEIS